MLTKEGITFSKIILAVGRCDLRKGIDGLADRIKGLLWTGDRYVLLYIRLADGNFQWPRTADEARSLNGEEFMRLMDGFSIDPSVGPKRKIPSADPKSKRKR